MKSAQRGEDALVRILYTGIRPPSSPEGARVMHLPALQTDLFDLTLSPLPSLFETWGDDVTLVIYSRHAVRALVSSSLLSHDTTASFWCVGAKTAALVHRAFPHAGIKTPPDASQHFEGLSSAMALDRPSKCVIVLGLEDAERDLVTPLNASLIETEDAHLVTSIPAYRTFAHHDFATRAPEIGPIDWLAVTSPRGARIAHTHFGHLSDVRWAAIGPTSRDALSVLGVEVSAVPPRPGTDELVAHIVDRHHAL